MDEKRNKPRVFLSHSKKDIKFIQQLCDDLRRCQVDPWLDEYEIRHGQPWLDAIFEDGIPTCDAVIVYITADSISSPVVKKEIDVGILQKLKDSHIAFLPYVYQSELRAELRPDLQALQAPEWNSGNYSATLPRVVSEIWRSFLGRSIVNAVQAERLARLEAEMRLAELEKKQAGSVFSQGEIRDFDYIWSKLDRYEPASIVQTQGSGDLRREIGSYTYYIHVGSLLPRLSNSSNCNYVDYNIKDILDRELKQEILGHSKNQQDENVNVSAYPDIGDELLMYGLLLRHYKGVAPQGQSQRMMGSMSTPYDLMYTEKLERFKYWLAFEGKLPEKIQWKTEQENKVND